MKKISAIIFSIFILGMLSACDEASDSNIEESKGKPETSEEPIDNSDELEYDDLQELYLTIDEDATYESLLSQIENKNLAYREEDFNSGPSIKVAFEDGVTKFKHADSGDHVQISFNEELKIEVVEYFNNDIFITLFDYKQGTYWDFRDQPEYAGYYINTYNDKAGDFTIKYDNGNESETDYLKVDSKEEQFNYMADYGASK